MAEEQLVPAGRHQADAEVPVGVGAAPPPPRRNPNAGAGDSLPRSAAHLSLDAARTLPLQAQHQQQHRQ